MLEGEVLAGGGAVGVGQAACRLLPPHRHACDMPRLWVALPYVAANLHAGQLHSPAAAARRDRWEDRLGRSGGQHGGGAQGGGSGGELATPPGPTPGGAWRCWHWAACISSRRYRSMEASVSGDAGGGAGGAVRGMGEAGSAGRGAGVPSPLPPPPSLLLAPAAGGPCNRIQVDLSLLGRAWAGRRPLYAKAYGSGRRRCSRVLQVEGCTVPQRASLPTSAHPLELLDDLPSRPRPAGGKTHVVHVLDCWGSAADPDWRGDTPWVYGSRGEWTPQGPASYRQLRSRLQHRRMRQAPTGDGPGVHHHAHLVCTIIGMGRHRGSSQPCRCPPPLLRVGGLSTDKFGWTLWDMTRLLHQSL